MAETYTIEVPFDAALAWFMLGEMLVTWPKANALVPDGLKDDLNSLTNAFAAVIPPDSEDFTRLLRARDAKIGSIKAFEGDLPAAGYWNVAPTGP